MRYGRGFPRRNLHVWARMISGNQTSRDASILWEAKVKLEDMRKRLEEIRDRLQKAFDEAGGNQQDPVLREIAAEFDRLLIEYMKLRRGSANGDPVLLQPDVHLPEEGE